MISENETRRMLARSKCTGNGRFHNFILLNFRRMKGLLCFLVGESPAGGTEFESIKSCVCACLSLLVCALLQHGK